MIELGNRAVKAKGWRWMSGMLPLARDNDGDWAPGDRVWKTQGGRMVLPQGAIPDLSDPATMGCLLALVREAWDPRRGDDPILCTHQTLDGKWGVGSWVSAVFTAVNLPTYCTEAEALVAALEAA